MPKLLLAKSWENLHQEESDRDEPSPSICSRRDDLSPPLQHIYGARTHLCVSGHQHGLAEVHVSVAEMGLCLFTPKCATGCLQEAAGLQGRCLAAVPRGTAYLPEQRMLSMI